MENNPTIYEVKKLFALQRDAVFGLRLGTVVFANDAARSLFGREIEGMPVRAVMPEAELFPEGECVTAARLGGETRTVTVTGLDGLRVVTVQRPEPDPRLLPDALLTKLRSAAFSLRLSLDRMLELRPDDDTARSLEHSYYSLLHLIGQAADMNALSRDELFCRMQYLDLETLVRDLADSTAFFVREKGVELRCQLPGGVCPVKGDRARLQQLLLILLSNSLGHTPEGGVIRVGLQRAGAQYILSVDDNGEGMDAQAMAAAFTVPEETPLTGGGAGLGLSIAYGLARLHGGTLVLQSKPGEGTRVRLMLPVPEKACVRDLEKPGPEGPELILTELADVLPAEAYNRKYRD